MPQSSEFSLLGVNWAVRRKHLMSNSRPDSSRIPQLAKPSIAHGAYLCQAVLREAGKNSTWRLPGNGVGDAKHTPGVGAGGNPVRIRTCVNLTKPAPRSPLVLWGYYWGNIFPWDSLGLRPAIQSVRYAFA